MKTHHTPLCTPPVNWTTTASTSSCTAKSDSSWSSSRGPRCHRATRCAKRTSKLAILGAIPGTLVSSSRVRAIESLKSTWCSRTRRSENNNCYSSSRSTRRMPAKSLESHPSSACATLRPSTRACTSAARRGFSKRRTGTS